MTETKREREKEREKEREREREREKKRGREREGGRERERDREIERNLHASARAMWGHRASARVHGTENTNTQCMAQKTHTPRSRLLKHIALPSPAHSTPRKTSGVCSLG